MCSCDVYAVVIVNPFHFTSGGQVALLLCVCGSRGGASKLVTETTYSAEDLWLSLHFAIYLLRSLRRSSFQEVACM